MTVENNSIQNLDLQPSHTSHANASSSIKHVKTSIPFLLSYVDPEASFEDLMKASNARPIESSQENDLAPPIPDSQPTLDSGIDMSTWSFLQGLCGLFDFPENSDFLFESEPLWNVQDQQQSDDVQVRVREALQELELYNSRTKPRALDQPCLTNPRIRSTPTLSEFNTLIRTYFDYAALHVPVTYSSYFNIKTISSHLLLAILAIGGQLLQSVDIIFSSSQFFDLVEDFIFDQVPLQDPHNCGFKNHPLSDEALELLQAALIMLSTEVATKSSADSHSTCISRFLKLVTAIRGFSLTKVRRHDPFTSDEYGIDPSANVSSTWKRVLRDETMVR